MNLEKVFNFWYFQEILENLPQIELTQKNSYDKCNTYRTLFRFKKQELPSRIKDIEFNPINLRSGLTESTEDKKFYSFVQVYGGVIDYKKFLYDVLAPVFLGFSRPSPDLLKPEDLKEDLDRLKKEMKKEEEIEKSMDAKPLYSFSFFVSKSGKYVFYFVVPGRMDGHPVPVFLILPPLWFCLPRLLEKKEIKREELLLVLENLQEGFFYDFLLKKGQIDPEKLLIRHYVLDFSFLMDLADQIISGSEKNRDATGSDFLSFVVRNNPGVKFYISRKDIDKLKSMVTEKEKDNDSEKKKAEISLNMLRSLKKENPESFVIVSLENCLKIAKKLGEKYRKHSIIVLSTDSDIIGQAEDEGFHFSGIPRIPCALSLFNPVDEKFVHDMFENFKKKVSGENNLFREIMDKVQEPIKENQRNKQNEFTDQKEIVFKVFIPDKRRVEAFHKVFETLKNEIDNTFMFSFFMEDIEKAKELYQKKNRYTFTDSEGRLRICSILKDYLEGTSSSKKIDSYKTVKFLLNPDKIPSARWPVKEKIYPFFSQYLAITATYHHFLVKKEEKIISVNGPPGTGKTTLLKEYIANSLVCMAETVSKFIINSSSRYLNFKKGELSSLFKKLPEYSIIVASANNNAVLNVTKDLPTLKENPALKEIIEKFLGISRNFSLIDWFYPTIERTLEEKIGRFIEKAVWICAAAISTDCFAKTFEDKNLNSLKKIFIPLCKDSDLKELLKDCIDESNNSQSSNVQSDAQFVNSAGIKTQHLEIQQNQNTGDSSCNQKNYNVMLLAAPLGRTGMTRPFFQTLAYRFKKCSAGLKNSRYLKEMIKKNYNGKNNKSVTSIMKSFLRKRIIPDFLNQKRKLEEYKQKIKKYESLIHNFQKKQKELIERDTKIKKLEEEKFNFNKELELIERKVKENEAKQTELQTEEDILVSEIEKKKTEIGSISGFKFFLSFLFPKVRKLKREINCLETKIEKIREKKKLLTEEENEIKKQQKEIKDSIKNLNAQINIIKNLQKTLKSYLKEIEYEKRTSEKEFSPDYSLNDQNQDNRMEKFFLPREYIKKLEEEKKEEKEKFIPYASEILKREQEKLFVAALRVLLYTAFTFSIEIQQNLKVLNQCIQNGEQNLSSINPASVLESWGAFFLLFPVVSTTFHSLVSRVFRNVELGSLGTFMIDEAGQGLPQMALGGLLRCKRAIVTGDPLQLEPVVTIPSSILKYLTRCLDIDISSYGLYLGGLERAVEIHNGYLDSSVQILADRASLYRGKIPLKEDRSIDVGIPLRVHFRCDLNIMKVSNETTYGNTMVHFRSDPSEGEIIWYDNTSNDSSQWINGHASNSELEICLFRFDNLVTEEGLSPEDIFIISPFRTVASTLKRLFREKFKNLSESLFRNISLNSFLKNNVGTIHTFQGKEAKCVILVLGGKTSGARRWAARKPNLLNVAVTRARNKLMVIGKTENWRSLDYFKFLYQVSTSGSLSLSEN